MFYSKLYPIGYMMSEVLLLKLNNVEDRIKVEKLEMMKTIKKRMFEVNLYTQTLKTNLFIPKT